MKRKRTAYKGDPTDLVAKKLWSKERSKIAYKKYKQSEKGKLMTRKQHRLANLRKRGVTQEDIDKLHQEQEGLCAICKVPGPYGDSREDSWSLELDHDHRTGVARGLLCSHCNKGLGHFRDNPFALGKAIEYLEKHEAKVEELK